MCQIRFGSQATLNAIRQQDSRLGIQSNAERDRRIRFPQLTRYSELTKIDQRKDK